MRILVFDTETTGLPQTKIINPETLDKWPTILQFSYIIFDTQLNEIIEIKDYIIKIKENIIIPEDSIKIHGIKNENILKNGVLINIVLSEFFHNLKNIDILVGHNIYFDLNMIKIELLRIIYENELSKKEIKNFKYNLHFITNYNNIYCTLKETINLCNIKSINKYGKEYLKYPKLNELHEKLFNSSPKKLHNSLIDILITLRCYIKLKYNYDLLDNSETFKKQENILNIL
jgi:DNA polymerase III epsilon subunit-like protein